MWSSSQEHPKEQREHRRQECEHSNALHQVQVHYYQPQPQLQQEHYHCEHVISACNHSTTSEQSSPSSLFPQSVLTEWRRRQIRSEFIRRHRFQNDQENLHQQQRQQQERNQCHRCDEDDNEHGEEEDDDTWMGFSSEPPTTMRFMSTSTTFRRLVIRPFVILLLGYCLFQWSDRHSERNSHNITNNASKIAYLLHGNQPRKHDDSQRKMDSPRRGGVESKSGKSIWRTQNTGLGHQYDTSKIKKTTVVSPIRNIAWTTWTEDGDDDVRQEDGNEEQRGVYASTTTQSGSFPDRAQDFIWPRPPQRDDASKSGSAKRTSAGAPMFDGTLSSSSPLSSSSATQSPLRDDSTNSTGSSSMVAEENELGDTQSTNWRRQQ